MLNNQRRKVGLTFKAVQAQQTQPASPKKHRQSAWRAPLQTMLASLGSFYCEHYNRMAAMDRQERQGLTQMAQTKPGTLHQACRLQAPQMKAKNA